MARSTFGGTHMDAVLTTYNLGARQLLELARTTLRFYDAPTGGTQYTDLLDADGNPVTSIVTGLGQVPVFQGPDGVTEMWADDGDGERALMVTQGRQGPPGEQGPPGTPGQDGAPGGSDAAFAGWVNDEQSQTGAALSATFARTAMQETVGPFKKSWAVSDVSSYRMIGYDAVTGTHFATNWAYNVFVQSEDGGSTWNSKGFPAGTTANEYSIGRANVVRHKGKFYLIMLHSGSYKLFRTDPTPGATAFTWEGPLFTLSSGATGYQTGLSSDGTYLYLGEYNDPASGARIHRSADGTTWEYVYTVPGARHVHAVEPDPYNPGHVWATSGDPGSALIVRSADYGQTWTVLTDDPRYQGVQISFSPNWVWIASDHDDVTLLLVDRDTNAIYSGTSNSHRAIAAPGGRAGSQTYYDGVTNGTTTFTSATAAFEWTDAGAAIRGAGIPAGATIASVQSATSVTLSAAATTTATGGTFSVDRFDSFFAKCWWGAVDPDTEAYFFAANYSITGGTRQGLFWVPFPGGPVQLLDVVPLGPKETANSRMFVNIPSGDQLLIRCGSRAAIMPKPTNR